ncbi:MAG: radical SAM family heme chaperone HemW [Desulfarculus sp.]|nr:radical SAM family heme chaperone HemW [Desulfarculus sp.]
MISSGTRPCGLYIHLPFCAGRCPYCDFFAQPLAPGLARVLLPALLRHLEMAAPLAGGRALGHVYLGGGTPSLLPAGIIARLIQAARQHLGLAPACEISLEANPGTLSAGKLQALKAAGVNRLSLGAQSFDPALLKLLGRRHTPQDTRRAVAQARAVGFANLSLDLIYGLPGQTLAMARGDILAALELRPDHLSLYELTLAPETPFGRAYAKGRPPLPSEDQVLAMEDAALELLEAAGLARYEVSNFARPGHECRHNQDTWRGGDYLALGPGAHGHLAGRRWAWLADVKAYVEAVRAGREPLEFSEDLTPRQRAWELIMLGLRTVEGVDLARVGALLDRDPRRMWAGPLAQLSAQGWARLEGDLLMPTPLGLRLADAAAGLFL